MEYINHVTLTTGHIRKSYPDEIDKALYFRINRIIRESEQPAGAPLEQFPGYRVKTIRVPGGAVATLYGSSGLPVLTTGCRLDDSDGNLWTMLHKTSASIVTRADEFPPSPYVADRIEPGARMHPDALLWTADFARCFAWAILAPDQIR